jgi:copper resistance protein B
LVAPLALASLSPAFAQDASGEPAATPAHAADLFFDPAAMARARERLLVENGGMTTVAVIVDELELLFDGEDHAGYGWDAQGWYGGDIHRLWWKSEGEGAFDADLAAAELHLLYSRAVTPYFDVQAGVRWSLQPEGDRTDFVLGAQGLAPYWFEVDTALFVSDEGDVTARAMAEYDLRLTQRLILQPKAEINAAAQDIDELAIASGLTSAALGLRLRYEIRRDLAPYVGVAWESALGGTGDLAEANGEDADSVHLVVGLRAFF